MCLLWRKRKKKEREKESGREKEKDRVACAPHEPSPLTVKIKYIYKKKKKKIYRSSWPGARVKETENQPRFTLRYTTHLLHKLCKLNSWKKTKRKKKFWLKKNDEKKFIHLAVWCTRSKWIEKKIYTYKKMKH